MREIEISEKMLDIAWRAFCESDQEHDDYATALRAALAATISLAFAAELRILLAEMEDYEKLGEVFRLIESRIAELDPEGLTS